MSDARSKLSSRNNQRKAHKRTTDREDLATSAPPPRTALTNTFSSNQTTFIEPLAARLASRHDAKSASSGWMSLCWFDLFNQFTPTWLCGSIGAWTTGNADPSLRSG